MDQNRFMANVIIHGFAVAHAITAATLAQTIAGDEAALTALTVGMFICLCRLYNAPMSWGRAIAYLGVYAGFYLGTRGATCLIKWVPLLGNAANALSTTFTTEVLGWSTVFLLSRGRDLDTVTKEEAGEILSNGKKLRRENAEEIAHIAYVVDNCMSYSDKTEYKSLIDQLKKDIPDTKRKELIQRLKNLFMKYH